MPILVQVLGSLLVLCAFVGLQASWMTAASRVYLWLNVIGSVALAVSAIAEAQWGFLILEIAWTGASAVGLLRLRGQPASPEPGGN